MSLHEIIAILRNPWGIPKLKQREARLAAADILYQLQMITESPAIKEQLALSESMGIGLSAIKEKNEKEHKA